MLNFQRDLFLIFLKNVKLFAKVFHLVFLVNFYFKKKMYVVYLLEFTFRNKLTSNGMVVSLVCNGSVEPENSVFKYINVDTGVLPTYVHWFIFFYSLIISILLI